MRLEDYDELVQMLDQLIDEVGEDKAHPLASLIERYEDEHVAELG